MSRGGLLGSTLAGFVLVAAPALAFAGEPEQVGQRPPAIHGGLAAGPCQWPSSVALYENNVLCSGTLVHPRLVLTAAHCIGGGPGPSVISFGESAFEPARTAAVDHCLANPQATGSQGFWDYAYCLLAEPVEDIAPTPVLMGCETKILKYGQPVVISGFGADDGDQSGLKRWAQTIVTSEAAGDTVLVGAEGTAACSGDSGGPAFVQLGDGSWRAFGIVSGGLSCDEDVTYVTMHSMIAWAEAQTGMDFTPCHDGDGSWNPGPDCAGFALDPTAPRGAWPSCEAARSGSSSTCGPAYASEGDVTPPSVAILEPLDGASFAEVPASVAIEAEAEDDGGGVERVELWAEGMLLATDEAPPWRFEGASFPAGSWTLEARAVDWWGNEASSAPVTVFVGEGGETGGTDTGGTDSGGADEAGEGPGAEGGGEADGGCSLTGPGRLGGPFAVFALLALAALRRREP